MLNFTPANTTPTLRHALRWTNKLLKLWFIDNMPLSASSVLGAAMDSYKAYVEKLNALQQDYENASAGKLEKMISTLSFEEEKELDAWPELEIVIKMRDEVYQYKRRKILDEFTFYIYMDERSDSDLTLLPGSLVSTRKEMLNIITQALQNITPLSDNDVEALFFLYTNIHHVMKSADAEKLSKKKIKFLLPMLKIGLHIIEAAERHAKNANLNNIEKWFVKIGYPAHIDACMKDYFVVATIMTYQASDDMDLLMAESCMQTSEKLYEKWKLLPAASLAVQKFGSQIHNMFHSLHALINLKNNDLQAFNEHIQKLHFDEGYSQFQVDVFSFAGDYFKTLDPVVSCDYYDKAIMILSASRKKETMPLMQENFSDQIKEIEGKSADVRKVLLKKQREAIRQHFPELKIATHPKDSLRLVLFLPMDRISASFSSLFEKQNVQCFKFEKVCDAPRGVQFTTTKVNVVQAINELTAILNVLKVISAKSIPAKPISQATSVQQPAEPLPMPASEAPSVKQGVRLIEEPVKPYERPVERVKEKTHKAPATALVPLPVPAAVATTCHAADFGFKEPSNPLVTPVYCSLAAQKNRRTKLYVSFKGIEGVDKDVEELFKSMLNPRPEGILTVATVNQAGAKLWKDPNALGDAWNLCALRFKRKGAAGWLRALTTPVEKVTVLNEQGKEENRYLFSLGKPLHK